MGIAHVRRAGHHLTSFHDTFFLFLFAAFVCPNWFTQLTSFRFLGFFFLFSGRMIRGEERGKTATTRGTATIRNVRFPRPLRLESTHLLRHTSERGVFFKHVFYSSLFFWHFMVEAWLGHMQAWYFSLPDVESPREERRFRLELLRRSRKHHHDD